jgi:hypothetical protein
MGKALSRCSLPALCEKAWLVPVGCDNFFLREQEKKVPGYWI